MTKKIGLITLQDEYTNYGAALQVFALYLKIKELGFECEIINLKRPHHSEYKYTTRGLPLAQIDKKLTLKRIINRAKLEFQKVFSRKTSIDKFTLEQNKTKKFKQFFKKLNYTKDLYSNIDEINSNPPIFDIYLTGSDQVWNPYIRFTTEPYFLTFAPESSIKVAYAPSFGISELPDSVIPRYKKWVNGFKHLSVREESGQKILNQLTDKTASIVLDPTFLLSQQEWSTIAKEPKTEKQYLFIYCLGNDLSRIIKISKYISKLLNLEIIMANDYINDKKYKNIEIINDLSPEEFLGYIKNARFVLTNSFHGTVFSIKFQKQFYSFATTNVSSRITNLLDKFSMSSRLWKSKSGQISKEKLEFDYAPIANLITKEINHSIEYLNNSIK